MTLNAVCKHEYEIIVQKLKKGPFFPGYIAMVQKLKKGPFFPGYIAMDETSLYAQ